MLAIGSMNPNFGRMFGGTSTNCSAVCGSMRNVREQRDGDGILGTAITSSETGVSRCRSIATSWSTPCGTAMSRIWIMGTTSASCSTVRCVWPPQLTQAGWQGTRGLFLVQLGEPRLGRKLYWNLAVTCNSYLLPLPACFCPRGAVRWSL